MKCVNVNQPLDTYLSRSINGGDAERQFPGLLVSDGNTLIITVYVHVMRYHPEKRRTSYPRHSSEWIGIKECIYNQWEESHNFPINRGWHKQFTHCTTVADLNHARRHAIHSNCISLQDHRQQRILIARSRPILILQDSFSLSLQLARLINTFEYLCSTFGGSLLLHRSKLTNSSTKWKSFQRIFEWNRILILSLPTDLIEGSVLRICSDSRLICLFISPLALLRPVVGFRPPSNCFILSFRLTMPSASLPAAIQNTTLEGVLSLCWCSLNLTLTT